MKSSFIRLVIVIVTSTTIFAWSHHSFAKEKVLELSDYLDWENVADPQLSPDGKRIIYSRIRVNKMTDSHDDELWQMSADGGRNRFLLNGSHARWSPDGERIAYIGVADDGNRQLFVRRMDADGSVTQITHNVMGLNLLAWSPDGASIAFRAQVRMTPPQSSIIDLPARPPGAAWTEDPPVFDRLHYRRDKGGIITGFDHLFVVSATGGRPRQLTSGNWDVGRRFSSIDFERDGAFQWFPDGKHIVFSGEMDPDKETNGWTSQIHEVEVATGKITTLMDEPGSWGMPSISPDGKLIAFLGNPPLQKSWPMTELRVMNRDGSGARVLASGLTHPFFDPMKWAANGRGLYFIITHHGSSNISFVSLDGKMQAATQGVHRLSSLSSIVNGIAVGVISAPHVTRNVARISLRNGTVDQLTNVNDDILANVELGEVEEIWYESTDNTRVQGWIVKPPDFDPNKRYPLVLDIHGGPNFWYDVSFRFEYQEWASQGYVVLYTNPRGSAGYDEKFLQAIDNAYPGRVDSEDLLAGVDAVIARGYIDEKRLYVTGCSGGGTLTAWLVGYTDRFAAAAARCPIINWISMASTTDAVSWAMNHFRTPFWEDPELWLEHSPLMHVANVKTPTLLITGENDRRTPLSEAEAFYAALKMLNVPTRLIPMRNEGHGTTSVPSNMLRTQLYMRKWFEEHGGGGKLAPSADGS